MEQNQNELKTLKDKTDISKLIIRISLLICYLLVILLSVISFFKPGIIERLNNVIIEIKNSYDLILYIAFFSVIPAGASILLTIFNSIDKDKNKFLEIDKEKLERNQEIINFNNYPHVQTNEDKQDNEEKQDILRYKDFYSYFYGITKNLDNQIEASDQKASILLQSGKKCIISGIVLYIIAIVLWQFLVNDGEFKFKYAYGMFASSLLFIFIEFFGAWFLRQYKQFVDTSTYLIKIKSILQRYILAFLALNDAKEKDFDISPVISMLQEEIKWPETYLLKKPDVNFAKECLETATNLIKSVQDKNKSKDEK